MQHNNSFYFIILFGVVAFFVASTLNRKKMAKKNHEMDTKLVPGVPVMLSSGMFGTLVKLDDASVPKKAHVEIAPGIVTIWHRQAISMVVETPEIPQAQTDNET